MGLVARWVMVWAWVWAWAASKTLYRLNSYPGNCYLSTQNYTVQSIIVCAIVCKSQQCVFFSFKDGVCEVHDAGLDQQLGEEQVRVFTAYQPSTPKDVARSKPTLPTFQWDVFVSPWAVDGDNTTQYHSLGPIPSQSWLRVDLGAFYTITSLDIYPNPGVASRFRNVEIRTGATNITDGNFASYTMLAYYTGPWDGVGRLVFPVSGQICARYLSVQGTVDFLNIFDLKIFA